jgi:thioredoxin 1
MTDPAPPSTPGRVVDLTDASALPSAGVALVDFHAAWCAPCHGLTPVLLEVAEARPEVLVARVDVGDHPDAGERMGVTSLPTLVVLRDGAEIRRLYGVKNARQLLRAIDAASPARP